MTNNGGRKGRLSDRDEDITYNTKLEESMTKPHMSQLSPGEPLEHGVEVLPQHI